jgi:hypothetical protein
MMSLEVIGFWDKKRVKLKQIYPLITDEDLSFSEGKEKEMMEMLGYKLGKTKEELIYIISCLE